MATLEEIVERINAHTATCVKGTTAPIYVAASGYISLGFDPKEVVTKERLEKAILENFARHLEVAEFDAIDETDLAAMHDES